MKRTWVQCCTSTLALAFLGATIAAAPAFAQEPAKQEPKKEEKQKAEEEKQRFVEEMTVTAQKRTENVQDVPSSVLAIAGEDLGVITTGGPDVRFMSARVPSLLLESSFGRAFPRFYIRGLGNTDFDLNASQPVSMLIDEVVLENPVAKGMPLWDLERVEVLRGPQGTLFGRNTPAGVVKFETKKPSREYEASFRLSYGTFNTVDFNGGIGGPLSDTVSARLSLLYQHQSDWVDNKFRHEDDALGGYETKAYRVQFLWEPSDTFRGLLNVHGWDLDGTARIFRANMIKKGTNDIVAGFRQDTVYQDGLNKQEISSWGGVMRLENNFGSATLTSITGYETLDMYSRGDIDGGYGAVYAPPYGPGLIPFVSETADGIPKLDQFTEELRLASNTIGPWGWLVGAFYFDESLKAQTFDYNSLAPGNPQDGYAFQTQDATSYALFGSVDYLLSERWSLKAGLRYSHDKKDFAAERPMPTFLNTVTVRPITRHTSAGFVNWDLSALYRVSPDFHVYGRIGTGSRAPSIQGRILFCADPNGGTDPATNCVSVADTETLTSLEVGIKTILADRRLRMNLTAYVYRVHGQQVTAVGGQYNTATLFNVDKTEGHGLEADLEYIPTANWWMTFGLSYNPTKIVDRNLTVTPCGGGCTVLNPVAPNAGVYVNGNSLPHAPDWIINGIVNFQTSPLDKGFFGSLDWFYYSDKSFFLYKSKEFHANGYGLGLRLGYGWHHGMYELALYGRNITNKIIVEGGIDFDNLTGMTNEPRKVGIEFVTHL